MAGHVKLASRELAKANTALKDKALKFIAEEIDANRKAIMAENQKD